MALIYLPSGLLALVQKKTKDKKAKNYPALYCICYKFRV